MDIPKQTRKAKIAGALALIAGFFLLGVGLVHFGSRTGFNSIGMGLMLIAFAASPAVVVEPVATKTPEKYSRLSRLLFLAAFVTFVGSTIYLWGTK